MSPAPRPSRSEPNPPSARRGQPRKMSDLTTFATMVCERWIHQIGGDYAPPPCPPPAALANILTVANYAAGHPEESRLPRFNVTASPADSSVDSLWKFSESRPFAISEVRRLIPATDPMKSAIHVQWSADASLLITGIHDLGTSWHRMRQGLAYAYEAPPTIVIEVERVNRLSIYEGEYRIASFLDGQIEKASMTPPMFLHPSADRGLSHLLSRFSRPRSETLKECTTFEFMALWNTYAALANSVASAGHGGAIVLVPPDYEADPEILRSKYPMHDAGLTNAFVEFVNARHRLVGEENRQIAGKRSDRKRIDALELQANRKLDDLNEAIAAVARLTQVDGATIISSSLQLMGFGAEIVAPARQPGPLFESFDEFMRRRRDLTVEEFGMRHRSAINLVRHMSDAVVLVASQDGPLSGIWAEADGVYMRRGVRLVNPNNPWG